MSTSAWGFSPLGSSLIATASATPEGGGDSEGEGGDQGGDEGGGDQSGDEGGGDSDGSTDFQSESDTAEESETTDETETDEETEPEPSPQLDITPETSPTPQGLTGLAEICGNGQDDDNDGATDSGDNDCSPGAQGACPPGTPNCFVSTSPLPSPGSTDYTFYCRYVGGPACNDRFSVPFDPIELSPTSTPGPAASSRLDPYAECIVFPFSMKCQNGIPTDPNLPALTPPDATTCNLDKNYPGCPGADVFKFNQQSIACEAAFNSAVPKDLYFCKNPAVTSATTPPTPSDPCADNPTSAACLAQRVKCLNEPTAPECQQRTQPASPTPPTTPLQDMVLSPSPTPTPSPSPSPSPAPTAITNINNNQVIVREDGGYTVQSTAGALTSTPDCPTKSATIVLGPSPMQAGGARILAAFDPCFLTDGGVVFNIPDEEGVQLVAANIQGGQTTQSVVVPLQRVAPITQGQTVYTVDLSGQITGSDPSSGNPVTLNGNINALFLRNAGGQNIEFSADNSAALNAVLS